jgi:hypothetical protein
MDAIDNNRLINLWTSEVLHLLTFFQKFILSGEFVLFSCSAERIIFINKGMRICFCYDYNRYIRPDQAMIFVGITYSLQKDGIEIAIENLIKEEKQSFELFDYLSKNSSIGINYYESYHMLMEEYLLEVILESVE